MEGLPKLLAGWKLWSGKRPRGGRGGLYVVASNVFKLCMGDRCAELQGIAVGVLCETKECRTLAEELLGRGSVFVAASQPGPAEAGASPLVDIGKVPELAAVIRGAVPCKCLGLEMVAKDYEAFAEILSLAPQVEDPGGRWKMYIARGGLVVAGKDTSNACVVVMEPGHELDQCRDLFMRVFLGIPAGIKGTFSNPEVLKLLWQSPGAFLDLLKG